MRHEIVRRYLATCLGLVGIAISSCSLSGCSGQEADSSTTGTKSADEIVLGLTRGSSVGDVEASLGEPVSETTYGNEVILGYPPWQLRFQEGELHLAVREVRSGKVSRPGPKLDRKVLSQLEPGMTVRAVRKTLGAPEVYEEIYEFGRRPAVVLRYAYWELYFRKGLLVRRTQN